MRRSVFRCIPVLAIIAAGCKVQQPPSVVFQRQRFDGVSYRSAFDAAERALGERFAIEARDPAAGILRARPVPETLDPSGRRISDRVGHPGAGRRLAELRVQQEGSYVDVYCRVLIQELETERFRMAERQRGVYDQPTDTPADTEAGTTPEQNAVWVNRSRDRDMERQILRSVEEFVRPSDPGT